MNKDTVVNCQQAQELVSALYDGERVPTDFADHVDACPNCRERLRSYSHIGAELRLLASRTATAVPMPAPLPRKGTVGRSRFLFVKGRILVPRFAVAMAAGLFLLLAASLMRLHAQQSRPLWFQFSLDAQNPHALDKPLGPKQAVQAGFDDALVWGDGPDNVIGTHLAITAVKDDSVQLAVRSRRYYATNADELHVKKDLGDLSGHTFTYYPGKPLQIPIEGGGTVVLQGQIVDHKARFMFPFGIPLEPDPDQLILSSPVLISGKTVVFNMKGANAIATGADEEDVLYVPGTGLLRFALQPFPGAIQGVASWGNLDFKWDGKSYCLLTASQICGGDQPRTVWVKNDAQFLPADEQSKRGFLGANKLGAIVW